MITEDVSLISKVISVWGWHILAFMFFLKSIGFLVTQRYMWFFGLIGVFVICEVISITRKKEVETYEN